MSSNSNETLQQQLTNPGIADLAAAYVAAFGEIDHAVKNASNPHFGNDYADLSGVLDTVRPVFAKHKLAFFQAPGEMVSLPTGELLVSMMGMLIHESGQNLTVRTQVPLGAKATAQAAGSAYTYARRYQLAAIAGIAQVDDDGEAASAPPPKRAAKTEKKADAETSYASATDDLITSIKGCTALGERGKATEPGELEYYREQVTDVGDRKVVDEFVAKQKALKAAKKAA